MTAIKHFRIGFIVKREEIGDRTTWVSVDFYRVSSRQELDDLACALHEGGVPHPWWDMDRLTCAADGEPLLDSIF